VPEAQVLSLSRLIRAGLRARVEENSPVARGSQSPHLLHVQRGLLSAIIEPSRAAVAVIVAVSHCQQASADLPVCGLDHLRAHCMAIADRCGKQVPGVPSP
jgi:hypothetical protein